MLSNAVLSAEWSRHQVGNELMQAWSEERVPRSAFTDAPPWRAAFFWVCFVADAELVEGALRGDCFLYRGKGAATIKDTFRGFAETDGRLEPSQVLRTGSHAFVRCDHERGVRVVRQAMPFGDAQGHQRLADEQPVLYAGEIEVDGEGRITRWTNMSGTYSPPAALIAQVGPLMRYEFVDQEEVRRQARATRD